jgi:hypothetical protein
VRCGRFSQSAAGIRSGSLCSSEQSSEGWIGLQLKGVLLETCLHGTGPQERWCFPEYSFTGVTAASAAAGAVSLLLLSGVAVNRRAIERRKAADSAISTTNIG